MAGDHKCPVCSSTFTRPQHVARHMRSHTGDRPYKCVHCGDQFARSDLLSRHVNKCHASEKPPTTTQPARRKGHAQPGSSSAGGVRGPAPSLIPPPGSRKICDPCAHSRTPAQCDSGLPCGKCLQRNTKCTYVKANEARRSAAPPHDLFVGPAQTVPSMTRPGDAPPPVFPSQPAFNFTVPLYPQSLDPRSSSAPYPPPFDASHPSSSASPGPPVYPNIIPNLGYTDARKHSLDSFMNQPYQPNDLPAFLYSNPASSSASDLSLGNGAQQQQQQQQQQQYGFAPADMYYDEPTQRDVVGSDFTFSHQPGPHGYPPPPPAPADSYPAPAPSSAFPPQQQQQQQPPEAGFSNAFGLMSLDDPAIAAEMSKNGAYFAPGALRGTKIPDLSLSNHGLPTPGKDANIAELRDFWKAFMRDHTPSEAPSNKTPINNGNGSADLTRPGMRRSLSKMASLPDIKTPPVDSGPGPQYSTLEEARGYPHAYPAHLHPGREDLRSYEQAVLARKAPSLTLAPPRKRTQTGSPPETTTSSTDGEGSGSAPARPSFKRLASQTLGPFESKSVKVSHPAGAGDAIAAYESGGIHGAGAGAVHSHSNNHHQHHQHHRQHVRSPSGEYPPVLHEGAQRRRLSAPTSGTRPTFEL